MWGQCRGPEGGVDGSRGASMAGVAGLAGRGRLGIALIRAAALLGGEDCGGKKWVASGAMWQAA